MGTTPKYGIRWPEPSQGNDVSGDLQKLATDVEAGLQVAGRVVAQTFTTSGTWTKPVGCLHVIVQCIAAGGGGGYPTTTDSNGRSYASGGGGGEFAQAVFSAATLDPTVSVVVGAGGAGATPGQPATAGGNTTFGDLLLALPGPGGRGDLVQVLPLPGGGASAISAPGLGGYQVISTADSGGNSATGSTGSGSMRGGGGGGGVFDANGSVTAYAGGASGAAARNAGGGGASPGTASTPGSAGASSTTRGGTGGGGGQTGGVGGAPGGGGGAGTSAGGNGGRGEVRVYAICTGK